MPIRPLLELGVDHAFFASGRFATARIAPDAATAARLAGLRLAAKQVGGGLTVFASFDDAGRTPIDIPAGMPLGFTLAPLPPELALATDPAALAPGTTYVDDGPGKPLKATNPIPRTSEVLAKAEGAATLVLAGRPLPGTAAGDFTVGGPAGVAVAAFDAATNRIGLNGPAGDVILGYPVATSPSAPVAIALTVDSADVAAAAAGTPRRATVALAATAARWCYHLVTNLPNPVGDWKITRANGSGPAFGDAGRAELTAADAADPFGSDLLARQAPLRVIRFVSDAAVPASEAAVRRLALFAGPTQLFDALPNPSPAALRRVGGQPAFGEVVSVVTA